jgi:hypothetical protein
MFKKIFDFILFVWALAMFCLIGTRILKRSTPTNIRVASFLDMFSALFIFIGTALFMWTLAVGGVMVSVCCFFLSFIDNTDTNPFPPTSGTIFLFILGIILMVAGGHLIFVSSFLKRNKGRYVSKHAMKARRQAVDLN